MFSRWLSVLLLGLVCAGPLVAQGALDVIPADATGGIAVRNLDELQKKADKLVKDVGAPDDAKPGPFIALALTSLGITNGLDSERPIAVVLANIKTVDPKATNLDNLDKCIVGVLPFRDLDSIASNFGFNKGELKPGKVQKGKLGGFANQDIFCYAGERFLYAGLHEKAILSVARGKSVAAELPEARRKFFAGHDVVLCVGAEGWGEMWKEAIKELEKSLEGKQDEETQAARGFVQAIRSLRYGIAGVHLDKGVAVNLAGLLAKDTDESVRKFLGTWAGEGASSLRGLPEGKVVTAFGGRVDGSKSVALARVFFRELSADFLEKGKWLSPADRPGVQSVFAEIWQRLRGGRLALYKTADEQKQGLFSLVGIFDVEDPQKFLDELKLMARLGKAEGIDLTSDEGKKANAADIAALVKDLGHRRFPVRESATAKLLLAGEPVLPYLEEGLKSPDLETRKRAERIKSEIVQAAEARRAALLSGDFARVIKPSFAFLDRTETVGETEVRLVGVGLTKRDAAMVPQFRQLLGPEWNRVRLAFVGKQVVVLVGSDVNLLKSAVRNLKDNKPGLAQAPVLGPQSERTDPARKFELHMSMQLVQALATAADLEKPGKLPASPPLSTFALTTERDRVQLDVWVPLAEIKMLVQAAQEAAKQPPPPVPDPAKQ